MVVISLGNKLHSAESCAAGRSSVSSQRIEHIFWNSKTLYRQPHTPTNTQNMIRNCTYVVNSCYMLWRRDAILRESQIQSSASTYTSICEVKVKWSRYRPGVAQRVGTGIALLFHDRGTRRGWVVSSTPRPHFTPGKDPVPILQEVGWAPGPVWTGGKSHPHQDSILDHPARSQSLYRLSYPAHNLRSTMPNIKIFSNIKIIKYIMY